MNEDQLRDSHVLSLIMEQREAERREKFLELEVEHRDRFNQLKEECEELKTDMSVDNLNDMRQVTIVIHFDDKDEAESFCKRTSRMNTIDGNIGPTETVYFTQTEGKIIKLSIVKPND